LFEVAKIAKRTCGLSIWNGPVQSILFALIADKLLCMLRYLAAVDRKSPVISANRPIWLLPELPMTSNGIQMRCTPSINVCL